MKTPVKVPQKPFNAVYPLLPGYGEEEIEFALSVVPARLGKTTTLRELANACALEIEAQRHSAIQEVLEQAQVIAATLNPYTSQRHAEYVAEWKRKAELMREDQEDIQRKKSKREADERMKRCAEREELLKRKALPTQERAARLVARMTEVRIERLAA